MIALFWQDFREWLTAAARGGGQKRLRAAGLLRSYFFRSIIIFGIVFPLLDSGGGDNQSNYAVYVVAWIAVLSTQTLLADAFAGQRERGMLELLYCSPLKSREILMAKWLASMCYAVLLALLILAVNFAALCVFTHHAPALMPYEIVMGIVLALGPPLAAFQCWISLGAKTARDAMGGVTLLIMTLAGIAVLGAWMFAHYGGQILARKSIAVPARDLISLGWWFWIPLAIAVVAAATQAGLAISLRRLKRQRPMR